MNKTVIIIGGAAITVMAAIFLVPFREHSSPPSSTRGDTLQLSEFPEIPDLNIPEFSFPDEDFPRSETQEFGPDGSAPAIDENALLFRITVNRAGQKLQVNRFLGEPKTEQVSWTYGPAIAEFAVHNHTALDETDRRKWLIGTLGNWSSNIDYYLDLILQYNRSDPSRSAMPPARWAYYESIEPEIERLSAVVKSQADDVAFMLRFLAKQQWHALEDPRPHNVFLIGPPSVDVTLEHAYAHRVYRNYNAEIDYKEEVVSIANLTASNRNRNHRHSASDPVDFAFNPVAPADLPKTAEVQFPDLHLDFMFAQWDVTEGDLRRVREIIARWESLSPELLPVSAQELSLRGEAAERYNETTAPLLRELFHDAYRRGLNEMVRHLWYFSEQEMPRQMQPARPDSTELIYDEYPWVDVNGVPLVRLDTPLLIPDLASGLKFRIAVPQQGFVQARSVAEFVGFEHFNREDFEISSSKPIAHRLLHRLPRNYTRETIFRGIPRPGDYEMPPQSTRNYSIAFDPKIGQRSGLNDPSLVEYDSDPNGSNIPGVLMPSIGDIRENRDGEYFSTQFVSENDLNLTQPITYDSELADSAFIEFKSQNAELPFTVDVRSTLRTPYPPDRYMTQNREEELLVKFEFTTSAIGYPETFVAYGATPIQRP